MPGRCQEFFQETPIMNVYSMPTRVTFGDGCLKELPNLIALRTAKRVLVCTGGGSLKKNGHLDTILSLLKGKEVSVFSDIPAEPGTDTLRSLTKKIIDEKIEGIVAAGGGSVMDTAKTAAFAAAQGCDPIQLFSEVPKTLKFPIPIIAIPTTAGTGSEVTPFAVFWDRTDMCKRSLGHDLQYPADALVDPLLTHSMPPEVTASTGMDAFTQACEAYWNKNHLPLSDDYALSAIRRILPALPKAVANGSDAAARHEMMLGSLEAGLAFSNTRTAACHSISYPMTLRFGVTHGQAVGITLPPILKLNDSAMPERTARFCSALDAKNIDDAVTKVLSMMKKSGLKTRLSELGIKESDIDVIVKEGFTPDRMFNNPYVFTHDTLRTMLHEIL
jgi:phosphonate metabolism-associated iron-containing alcohol dehydrogenase